MEDFDFNVDKKKLKYINENCNAYYRKPYKQFLIEFKQLYVDFRNFYKDNEKQRVINFYEFVDGVIACLKLLHRSDCSKKI
jgi:hypothetical protein